MTWDVSSIVALWDHTVMLMKGIFREGERRLSQNGALLLRYINVQSWSIWQAAAISHLVDSENLGIFFLNVFSFLFLSFFTWLKIITLYIDNCVFNTNVQKFEVSKFLTFIYKSIMKKLHHSFHTNIKWHNCFQHWW